MSSTTIASCRSCAADVLFPILSLGRTPLANSLLTAEQLGEPEDSYPLEVVFCHECALLQITETVPAEKLFREYLYFSSFSSTMLNHARDLAALVIESHKLDHKSLVIEIASNDGYLLQFYQQSGIPVLGIEPATNVARIARERNVPTICEFFGAALAQRLQAGGRLANVVHAHNVLAHVSDLNGFMTGLSSVLAENGIAIIEVPYVKDLIDRCEFDTIYHEHLSYFSLTALDHLVQRHNLEITKVDRVDIHGGSLRVFIQKQQSGARSDSVQQLLNEESGWQVAHPDFYLTFKNRVEQVKHDLLTLLRDLKKRGETMAAYGASAKGSTLLNYCGIGSDLLDFVVDRSTFKQGLFTPGTHLPIYAPEKLLESMPGYVLLLTWNFADEILAQQAEYRSRHGRFIVPIPAVSVI